MTKEENGVGWEMDLPNSEAARDLIQQMDTVRTF